jgi:hypothetical protein
MALDLTSFDAALKEHYTSDRVENMVYMDNPFLALIPKYESFGGKNLPIPLIYGNPQGRSATFSQAQSRGQVTSSKLKDFVLTRVKDYSIATIDNETLEASKGNANAFLEAATVEIDGAINSLSRSLAVASFRLGFGEIGQIGNVVGASAVITLKNPDDVTNFEVDQVLVFSDTVGSSVLRDSGASLTIIAIDRSNGTLTMSANLNTISGLAQNDFLFVKGDRENAASPAMTKVAGFQAWVPASAPSSAAFFGVDRTSDVTRLAGLRLNAVGTPIEEALIEGASLVNREGQKLTHFFMNYSKYAELEKALGSKVQYIDLRVNAEVAFRGIIINTGRGPVKCIPDQNCPEGLIAGVNLEMWKLYSLGKAVRVIDTDGLQMLRQASSDGVEVRYGFYGNIGCRGPGANINISI